MGLLDSLANAALHQVLGSLGGGNNQQLINAALNMLTGSGSQAGGAGLAGLLQQLQGSGIADAVATWISTGPNQPVSADQLQHALGADKVAAVAEQAGVTPDQASSGLAALLPALINHLTPDGTVPDQTALTKGLNILKDVLLKA